MITKQELIEAFKEGYKCANDKHYINDSKTGLVYYVRVERGMSNINVEKGESSFREKRSFLGIPFTKEVYKDEYLISIRYGLNKVNFQLTEQEYKNLSDFVKQEHDIWRKERIKQNDKELEEELKKFKNCNDA